MYIMVSESSKQKKGIQTSPRDLREWRWIEMCIFPQKLELQLQHWSRVGWSSLRSSSPPQWLMLASAAVQTHFSSWLFELQTAPLPALLLQLGMQSGAEASCLPTQKSTTLIEKMALKCHHSLFSSRELLKGGITTQTHSVIKGLQASSHTYSYVVTAICSSYSCWRTRWCLSKAKPS